MLLLKRICRWWQHRLDCEDYEVRRRRRAIRRALRRRNYRPCGH